MASSQSQFCWLPTVSFIWRVRRIGDNRGLTRKQEMGQDRGMSILVRIG